MNCDDPKDFQPLPRSNRLTIGSISFEAFGDRILIQEDEFSSGYECPTCKGSGRNPLNPDMRCKDCEGKGGVLVVPDVAERKPTTGTIVSVGPDTKYLKAGQKVLYSSYSGHTVDLNRAGIPVCMRILHETEVLSLIEGHLTLKDVRGKSEISTYQG